MRTTQLVLITIILYCFPLNCWASKNKLTQNIQKAWSVSWERFYHPQTKQFYDYISSYEREKELTHLPLGNEVKKQYPNPCGYGTGMEDCMILGGAMLSMLVDMYDVNKEDSIKGYISQAFEGVKASTDISSVPGFVARGICPEDGYSFYINSSRDQYTHVVHGLWKFFNSPLSTPSQKEDIKHILINIAERMLKNVVRENNFDSLRADGEQDPLGISKMWKVEAHEAARLPMIYAAAWDVSKDEKYYKLYRKYIYDAIEQSEVIHENYAAYVFIQMACSFELLLNLETDNIIQLKLIELMSKVETMALKRILVTSKKLLETPYEKLAMLGPDWRYVENWYIQNGYNIPQWGEFRDIWHIIREAGESLLVLFMVENPILKEQKTNLLNDVVNYMNYEQQASCGVIFHLAAYWKACQKGLLK